MRVPWDRGGLRSYLLVAALLSCRADHHSLLWGLPLMALGLALQVYAKGCLRQDQVVATGGPYRFVRHPFYAANLLIDGGLAAMSGWWPLLAVLPFWWLAVYLPVMRAEEAFLSARFPETYPSYRAAVPRLVPLHRPLPARGEPFSWRNSNIIADSVLPRVLKTLALPLLLFLAQELKAQYTGRPTADAGTLLTVGAVAALLFGLAWELTRHLRDGRRLLPGWLPGPAARLGTALGLFLIAGAVYRFEIESPYPLALAGCLTLAASVALYPRRATGRLLAEGVALAGVAILCELPWLAPAPILLYTALALDQRLPSPEPAPEVETATVPVKPALLRFYHLVVVAGLALAVVKEMVS